MRLTTAFRIEQETLIVDLGRPRPILSSAPCGGGLTRRRYILNHQVPANPVHNGAARVTWKDPARSLGRLAERLGLDAPCVGLMTAVPLEHLVVDRVEEGDLWVDAFVTVGVSNAVRAGEPVAVAEGPAAVRPAGRPGTINIVLVTNARLAAAAMVGGLQVATESKTACLLEHRIPSWTGRPGATGTGTDAVVLAVGDGPPLRYAGTHTRIGSLLGLVVGRAVAEGLRRWHRWKGSYPRDRR